MISLGAAAPLRRREKLSCKKNPEEESPGLKYSHEKQNFYAELAIILN